MSSYLRQNYGQKDFFSQKADVFFTTLVGVMVVVFCGLSLTYLSHTNSVATKGYKIKQLQEERSQYQADQDIWNLKLTELQALNKLSASAEIAAMEDLQGRVQFVEPETQVAVR